MYNITKLKLFNVKHPGMVQDECAESSYPVYTPPARLGGCCRGRCGGDLFEHVVCVPAHSSGNVRERERERRSSKRSTHYRS